jgi:hypothetical protein
MITNKITITVRAFLINLDNEKDKKFADIIIKKEDIEKLIFKDSIGKNIPIDITFGKDCKVIHSKITVSIKNADGDIGFIIQCPNTRYTILNDNQTMLNLKADYIKSEMMEKYTQILNMDTEALTNIEVTESVESSTENNEIEITPV